MATVLDGHLREPTADELKLRELAADELDIVCGGGKRKPDGTAGGNVAAKWSLAQGAAA